MARGSTGSVGTVDVNANGYAFNLHAFGSYGVTTDWSAGLQAAVNAASANGGGAIFVPPGTYGFSTPVELYRGVHLFGYDTPRWLSTSFSSTVLRANTGFTGTGLLRFTDKASTGGTYDPTGITVRNLSLDGNTQTGSGIHGIEITGSTRDNTISDVNIRDFSGSGLKMGSYSGRSPQEFRVRYVFSYGNAADGFNLAAGGDNQFLACEASTNGDYGWQITGGAGNSEFVNCSAEWNWKHGLYIHTANDGPVFTNFVTDRNARDGVHIGSAASNQTISFVGLKTRRDGRNSGSGGGNYAGLRVQGTALSYAPPVQIIGLTQQVGRDDDGTGTYSPQIGVVATYHGSSYIQGRVWGQATSMSDAGTADLTVGEGTYYVTGDPGSQTETRSTYVHSDGKLKLRSSGTDYIQLHPSGIIQMAERSDPGAAPPSNGVYIFTRDNGAGKTELCAQFPTGAIQQIAIEP